MTPASPQDRHAATTREPLPLLAEVEVELFSAVRKFDPFNSPHEGYAVILEELEELWDHAKANNGRSPEARQEAIQVAAMALRYVLDVCDA